MKLITQSLCAIAALCLIGACSSDPITELEMTTNDDLLVNVENNTEFALEVMDVVNEYRATLDLPPLLWHPDSEVFAVNHCYYMVQQSEASHDNFLERAEALQDRGASLVSENIAFGFLDAESVLQGWLGSPPHKEAIEGNFTHSGIGIVYDENNHPYYTQLFIK